MPTVSTETGPSPRAFPGRYLPLVFGLLATILCVLEAPYCLSVRNFLTEEGDQLRLCEAFWTGQVLYRDFVCKYGPVFFLQYSLIFTLLGFSALALRIAAAIGHGLQVFMVERLRRRLLLPSASISLTVLLLFLGPPAVANTPHSDYAVFFWMYLFLSFFIPACADLAKQNDSVNTAAWFSLGLFSATMGCIKLPFGVTAFAIAVVSASLSLNPLITCALLAALHLPFLRVCTTPLTVGASLAVAIATVREAGLKQAPKQAGVRIALLVAGAMSLLLLILVAQAAGAIAMAPTRYYEGVSHFGRALQSINQSKGTAAYAWFALSILVGWLTNYRGVWILCFISLLLSPSIFTCSIQSTIISGTLGLLAGTLVSAPIWLPALVLGIRPSLVQSQTRPYLAVYLCNLAVLLSTYSLVWGDLRNYAFALLLVWVVVAELDGSAKIVLTCASGILLLTFVTYFHVPYWIDLSGTVRHLELLRRHYEGIENDKVRLRFLPKDAKMLRKLSAIANQAQGDIACVELPGLAFYLDRYDALQQRYPGYNFGLNPDPADSRISLVIVGPPKVPGFAAYIQQVQASRPRLWEQDFIAVYGPPFDTGKRVRLVPSPQPPASEEP